MPLRDFTEAEVVLKARRRLERPLLLMVWLGVFMFALWEDNVFYLAAATLVVGVNLLAVHRAKEVYVHSYLVNGGVLIAAAILVLEIVVTGNFHGREELLLQKLGNFLVLIQLCKLFERKRNRDYLQMITLSILLVVAATLHCRQLWFALMLVVYTSVACYTGMVFTLKRDLDAAANAKLLTEMSPLAPHRVAWNAIRHWPGRALVKCTAMTLMAILITGAGLFLVAPRMSTPSTRDPMRTGGQARSGHSGTVRLGRRVTVHQSGEIVMTVKLLADPPGKQPAGGGKYFRGKTYNRYADSQWRNVLPGGSVGTFRPAPPDHTELGDARAVEVSMVSSLLPAVYLPPNTVHVHSNAGTWQLDLTGQAKIVQSKPPPEKNVQYQAYSFVQLWTARQRELVEERSIAPTWASTMPVPSTQHAGPRDGTPPWQSRISPRVAELAEEWCEDLRAQRDALAPGPDRDKLNIEIAKRIKQKLEEWCSYTLDLSSADPSRDGVEDFLFHMHKGHCEYFASALTVMCQSLDIPARLASGFLLTSPPTTARRTYVRQRDAHAWPEIWTRSSGWVIVDPSPRRADDDTSSLWVRTKQAWHELVFLWHEHVVGYDKERRAKVGRWLAGVGRRIGAALASAYSAAKDGLLNVLARGPVWRVLVFLAIGIVVTVVVVKSALISRLTRRGRGCRASTDIAVAGGDLQFIQDLFDALVSHGLGVRPHETRRQLAARAAATMDLPADTLAALVNLYYRLRFSRHQPVGGEVRRAEGQVASVRRMLDESKSAAAADATKKQAARRV